MRVRTIEFTFDLTRDEAITICRAVDACPADKAIEYEPAHLHFSYKASPFLAGYRVVSYNREEGAEALAAFPAAQPFTMRLTVEQARTLRRALSYRAAALVDSIKSFDTFQRIDREIVDAVDLDFTVYATIAGVALR